MASSAVCNSMPGDKSQLRDVNSYADFSLGSHLAVGARSTKASHSTSKIAQGTLDKVATN